MRPRSVRAECNRDNLNIKLLRSVKLLDPDDLSISRPSGTKTVQGINTQLPPQHQLIAKKFISFPVDFGNLYSTYD